MPDFRIRVIVDPTGAEVGTKRVDGALNRTAASAKRLRRIMLGTFAGISALVLITRSVRLLADYSQQMSTVQAVTSATRDEFSALTEEAQRLGISTRFTASQAGEAMVFLARAGFEVNEILKTTQQTLFLAQAGAIGLGEAADITASVLRGFRLEAGESSRVVDVLSLAANSANTTVSQLGQGMKFVAPVAAGLKVSLEETTAAMTALSNSGLQATMAGTGLRRILGELEAPSSKTKEIFRELGIDLETARASTDGLVPALRELEKGSSQTGFAFEVFGLKGAAAFEVLASSLPFIEDMNLLLEDAEGTAERVAKIMDKNLKGALLALKSAWEGLILRIGDSKDEMGGLEKTVRGLTAGLRFLADNVHLIGAAFVAAIALVTAAILTKLVPSLTLGTIFMIKYTAATKGAEIATQLLGVKMAALKIKALLTSPLFGAALAAGAAYLAITKLNKGIEEMNEASKIVEKGVLTPFGKINERVMRTQKEIKRLQGILAKDPENQAAASVLKVAEDRLKRLQKELEKTTKKSIALSEAATQQNVAYQKLNRQLLQEERILKLGNREREIQRTLVKALDELTEAGAALTPRLYNRLEAQIRLNQSLKDQAEILDEIRGPAEDFERDMDALFALLERGAITVDEFEKKFEELTKAFEEGPTDPFKEMTQSLREQNQILQERINKGEVAARIMEIELDLAREGKKLTPEQEKQLRILLEQNAALQEQLGIMNKVKEADPFKAQIESLEAYNRVLAKRNAEGETAARVLQLEQQLLARGVDVTDKMRQKLTEVVEETQRLENAAREASKTIEAGFVRGLGRVVDEMTNAGAVMEDALVNTFHSAEEALFDFVRNGENSFRDFVDSLLDQITRLLVRMLLMQALNLVFPGAGALAGAGQGFFAGGRQHGGPVDPSRPFMVGERGPELFVPPGQGNILPHDQTAALTAGGGGTTVVTAPPPEVSLTVINVTDPKEIPAGMDSAEGERVTINHIKKNRNTIKKVLA